MSVSAAHNGNVEKRSFNRTSEIGRFAAMVEKELLELLRSFKLLWVPLVFILLGIMQPVSSYFMPIILEQAGNLPEGVIANMPKPQGAEVLAQTLQQFGTLGVLVLALVCMGVVSGERNSGAASLILVKPISLYSYIGSKWTAMLVLTWGSLAAGYLAAWYYTGLLIGSVPFKDIVSSLLIYGLWLTLLVTLTVFFSTMLKSPAGAAFSSIGCIAVFSLLAGIFPKQLGWSPGALSGFAYQAVSASIMKGDYFGWAIVSALAIIAGALAAAVWLLRRSSSVE
ncbi:ABC-2 type transport system permease protein [Paenibacillus castaneae]|uniref:ABC transporter permease n=1 Tax=Paenibacillus castaneae TaxID=474957 RepID=UPI000C9A2AA3|nr:ABC transporter permease subunit [Paenibacillus castaneae]NIK80502.1 ABC-2 type transport system permease protein [Paenibacillus castaneae]